MTDFPIARPAPRIRGLARGVLLLMSLGLLGSCSSSTGVPLVPSFTILPIPATTQFVATTTSFWARTDQDRQVSLSALDKNGQPKPFVTFKVPQRALLARPDGTPFSTTAPDSVLITMSLTDPTKLALEFQPSGLTFSATRSAELKFNYYAATGGDYNDDGKEDGKDGQIATQLAVWRQEIVTQPFVKQNSTLTIDQGECDLNVAGFTRYAIAY